MAAQDYYRSDEPNRYHSPVSDLSSSVGPHSYDKPLPAPGGPHHQTSFPPTHSGGYNDDLSYASNHYSKQSIDTAYDSPGFGSSSYNANAKPEGYSADNIPLQDTHNKYNQPPTTAYLGPGGGGEPLGRRRSKKKKKQRPWFCYALSVVQIAVFCYELARQAQISKGAPIAIKPQFNPMIGPSTGALIDMGARYVPCMKRIVVGDVDTSRSDYDWPCPDQKDLNVAECTLKEHCGFGGRNIPEDLTKGEPNQWYRFIVPMFLHVGLIHLLFNLFVQITLGGDMERAIGVVRFAIVYFVSGIFGFVFGGNLGSNAQPTVGASGCLFGIFALVLLDILYNWSEMKSPMKELIFLLIDIAISFVLGLLPFIDNFAHIGGFISGIALGIVFMRSPSKLQKRLGGTDDPPYTAAVPGNPYNSSTGDANLSGFSGFIKQPLGFFKGRKPLWWAWWGVRAAMLALILGAFIGLLNNFYVAQRQCSWCKYLSCIDVNNWCDIGDLEKMVTPTTTTLPAGASSTPAAPAMLFGKLL